MRGEWEAERIVGSRALRISLGASVARAKGVVVRGESVEEALARLGSCSAVSLGVTGASGGGEKAWTDERDRDKQRGGESRRDELGEGGERSLRVWEGVASCSESYAAVSRVEAVWESERSNEREDSLNPPSRLAQTSLCLLRSVLHPLIHPVSPWSRRPNAIGPRCSGHRLDHPGLATALLAHRREAH